MRAARLALLCLPLLLLVSHASADETKRGYVSLYGDDSSEAIVGFIEGCAYTEDGKPRSPDIPIRTMVKRCGCLSDALRTKAVSVPDISAQRPDAMKVIRRCQTAADKYAARQEATPSPFQLPSGDWSAERVFYAYRGAEANQDAKFRKLPHRPEAGLPRVRIGLHAPRVDSGGVHRKETSEHEAREVTRCGLCEARRSRRVVGIYLRRAVTPLIGGTKSGPISERNIMTYITKPEPFWSLRRWLRRPSAYDPDARDESWFREEPWGETERLKAIGLAARGQRPEGYQPPTTKDELISRYAAGEFYFQGASLRNADLANVSLAYADLSHSNLMRADLSHSRLDGCDMTGVDIVQADLSHCELSEAIFRDAKVHGANFKGAQLADADFSGASGRPESFRGCLASGSKASWLPGERSKASGNGS